MRLKKEEDAVAKWVMGVGKYWKLQEEIVQMNSILFKLKYQKS